MEKNYYDILGIETNATESEIKSAFRKLARKWHPDVAGNSPDVVKRFKEINEAYEVLSDAEKRTKYDILRGILHTKTKENKTSEKTNTTNSSSTQKQTQQKQESKNKSNAKTNQTKQKAENKNNSKNAFQDAWETFIKNTKSQEKTKQTKYSEKKIDGSDITSDITITMLESIEGTTRTINILHTEPCPKCHGRKFANGSICAYCKGVGEISVHKKLSVRIPEHVKQGAKIRIAGEGNQGFNGGKNGDLYLIVKIDTENSPFKYDGLNILQTVPVEPYEAVLGSKINIKTQNGQVSMKLMSGTMNGQKYRLAKQGLEKDGQKGDMIVTISIEIPKNLSKEEVILYEKLKQAAANRNIREINYEQ